MPGDVALGAVLRDFRHTRKLTLAAVARRAGCGESQLSYVESGNRRLHHWLAEKLDIIYDTGGIITSLLAVGDDRPYAPSAQRVPDDSVLLVQVPGGGDQVPISRRELLGSLGIGIPTSPTLMRLEQFLGAVRPNRDTLGALAEALDHYQTAARVLPPSRLIDALTTQVAVLESLRRRAGSLLRTNYLALQARYAESLSWLSEEAGRAEEALFWTDRATQWAQSSGWTAMTAYMFVRRSMMAVSFAGDGHRAVDHALAAYEMPDVPRRIQGLAAKQMAFGYALSWEPDASARALDQAMTLLDESGEEGSELGQRSVVSEDLYVIFRTTCDIYLSRGEAAIGVLEPRLATLSSASARTATITRAKLVRAYANIGQPHEAARLARQAIDDSTTLQSLSARSELNRAVPVLRRWRKRAEIADVLQRLQGDAPTNA
ncbi:helix-turn-helix domain-containing protein [Amycolatopsis samaneae]|uniref:Helix-turn-helix domain-containing protein n=1 Tax=Amycolatopsis samaneae TaxID=664691 RepID=A0ABW5GVU2_9PSEU